MTTTELARLALELPAEERRTLVNTLWESLEQEMAHLPLQDWQKKLLDERLESARDSEVWISGDEVEQEISSALAARRRS